MKIHWKYLKQLYKYNNKRQFFNREHKKYSTGKKNYINKYIMVYTFFSNIQKIENTIMRWFQQILRAFMPGDAENIFRDGTPNVMISTSTHINIAEIIQTDYISLAAPLGCAYLFLVPYNVRYQQMRYWYIFVHFPLNTWGTEGT